MKKIFFTFIIILLLCGCGKQKEITKKEIKKEEKVGETITYKDLNNTPISIYKIDNNKLIKLTEDTYNLNPLEDIGIFQIYPSNEDTISIDSFGQNFYDEWSKYNTNNNLKIGFNIKFDLTNNEHISYNILSPSNTFDKWEYFMAYLYDDYINQGKGFYSHIEDKDYNENTLFTSIKIQCNDGVGSIKDKMELTVFTYDSEDDFLDNEYRGNSKFTYTIKKSN
jgi:hypothetical protein